MTADEPTAIRQPWPSDEPCTCTEDEGRPSPDCLQHGQNTSWHQPRTCPLTGHVWTDEELEAARQWQLIRPCQYTPGTCDGCYGSC